MEQNDDGIAQGYLLLADISGYTEFLTGTELEHSHAILRELTKLIRERLTPPMRFVKLEGDAVFCFANAEAFPNGEQFLELVESCYFDFSNHLFNMTQSTTCECNACRAISTLDLKFVAHHGTFIVERDEDGRLDLTGADVILVHRLLKNTVIKNGGPQAYAFLSNACLADTSPQFSLPGHTESYESFGEVSGVVQDLAAVARQRRESARVRVTADEADLVTSYIVDAPPSVVWQYFAEPAKRLRQTGAIETGVEFTPNADGRIATGASSHCAHTIGGDGFREYLDWRPYEYFTCRLTPLPAESTICPYSLETFEFNALEDGRTEHRHLVRSIDRTPEGMEAFERVVSMYRELASQPTWGDHMRAVIAQDLAINSMEEPPAS